jgi:hypothetical protein
MATMIQTLTGCTLEQAEEAARKYGDEIWLAVESLLPKTTVAGDKFIPEKPKIDSGLTPEQQELCQRGRALQDKVNAVFSVAHSKTQIQPVQLADAGQQDPPATDSELTVPTVPTESQLDVPEKTPQ